MAGLLDLIGTPEGQGLLSAAFGGLAGARRGQPLNSLGRAGLSGLSGYADATDRQTQADQLAKRNELFELQLKQMRQAQTDADLARTNEAAFRTSIASPQQAMLDNAMSDGRGPTMDNAQRLAPVDPYKQQLWTAMNLGQMKPQEYLAATTKSRTPLTLRKGDVLVDPETYQPLAKGAEDTPDAPGPWREYQLAKTLDGYTGDYEQFKTLGPAMQLAATAPYREAQVDGLTRTNAYTLPPAPPRPAGVPVTAPDGKVYMFPNQKSADQFKARIK